MAHKGKVYPYHPFRDLSLSPGQTWGLPQSWVWSGILGTGPFASRIVGKTFRLDIISASYARPGSLTWAAVIPSPPFPTIYLFVEYRLTNTADMSEMQFEIGDTGFNATVWPWRKTTSSWPYNQMQPPIDNRLPAQFICSYGGVLIPAPWSAF